MMADSDEVQIRVEDPNFEVHAPVFDDFGAAADEDPLDTFGGERLLSGVSY